MKYDGEPEKLMLVDDLKKISPISLCDYLLAKVKMGAKKSAWIINKQISQKLLWIVSIFNIGW